MVLWWVLSHITQVCMCIIYSYLITVVQTVLNVLYPMCYNSFFTVILLCELTKSKPNWLTMNVFFMKKSPSYWSRWEKQWPSFMTVLQPRFFTYKLWTLASYSLILFSKISILAFPQTEMEIEFPRHENIGCLNGVCLCLKALPSKSWSKVVEVSRKIMKLGKDDPRRIIHSLKVGLALTLVSTLYYFKPFYDSFGVNTMWAVLTVVVVFEFSVGKASTSLSLVKIAYKCNSSYLNQ